MMDRRKHALVGEQLRQIEWRAAAAPARHDLLEGGARRDGLPRERVHR